MAENKMEQYCKLPIPITAYQTDKEFDIETLEGTHHASVGDYIITGVKGEQYPCKPDIFEKTYIKCGQANKMEQVAALYNKKLGEKFKLKRRGYDCRDIIYDARFTEDGLSILYDTLFVQWEVFGDVLLELLTGEAVIVNGRE